MREVSTGIYNIRRISPPPESALPDSSGTSSTEDEAREQCQTGNSKRHIFTSPCAQRQTSVSSATLIMAASAWRHKNPTSPNLLQTLLSRPLVLTDFCSLFSEILRIRPRSPDKCAELILSQLRDLRHCLDLSFADNTCNIGGADTIHDAPLGIVSHFTDTGVFGISSLGRKTRQGCAAPELGHASS